MTLDELLLGTPMTSAEVQAACAAAIAAGQFDAGKFTGAFPASVLQNAPRDKMVLSAASLAKGPETATNDEDITVQAFQGGFPRFLARVYLNGNLIKLADVSTVSYAVYKLNKSSERIAVDIPTATISYAVYDSLQSDGQASSYNFSASLSGVSPFTEAGAVYLVQFTITPVTGSPILVRFKVFAV